MQLPAQGCSIEQQRTAWRVADEAGFDHLWLSDHFSPTGGNPLDGTVWEAWSLLAAAAEATRSIRVGVLVTGNTYRHPSVLAKMAVTVDHLSGGRLEFGIGTAWAQVEHSMLGLEFPSAGERLHRLSEACTVLKLLWTAPQARFDGSYYRLEGAIAEPKPLQRPYPPVWIGGSGPRLLEVVARHADVWSFPPMAFGGATEITERVAIASERSLKLDERCLAVGRDPAEVRRAVAVRFDPDAVDRAVREAASFRSAGFSELIVQVRGGDLVKRSEQAAKLLPRLRLADRR